MTDSLTSMFQQQCEHLLQLQNRLLTSPIDTIPIDVYKELMTTYLCLSKINEAKFLWENLPAHMKTDKEFQFLASLVSSLNLKQYGDFYRLCQTALENNSSCDLSLQMNQYLQKLISRVTIQNVELIELAYKSISFDDLQKFFGLNTKMVQQICNDRAWQMDSAGVYVLPKHNDNTSAASNSNLTKLVELVCFLER
ncbi:unnamed protein product [Rotaria magnacalcarata]|uniref:COP9 signalosome complex subunit 8 n=2 Tax=Rotaria magnacalcarata TaxID=392030 RepID=A0A816T225_9BILA|nr:unnamed protein product [Rotaria magnacalcarata]CAF2090925.1 unnamed protein product [Rotaria magnacalcarata]CAF2112338.1 unnamed protein product [Rotaria magnacalcarata]CAF2227993.1 unnamed protein product [Rotaria magnacalcarata]CAF3773392.1 unnamed protein product [Rotaria magnacalcarata]